MKKNTQRIGTHNVLPVLKSQKSQLVRNSSTAANNKNLTASNATKNTTVITHYQKQTKHLYSNTNNTAVSNDGDKAAVPNKALDDILKTSDEYKTVAELCSSRS